MRKYLVIKMRKYNRPLTESDSVFTDCIAYLEKDIEYRILNGITLCKINREKVENITCECKIYKEKIYKERLALKHYINTYLDTYPLVDPINPYAFTHGMISRVSSASAMLTKVAISLIPNYRQKYFDPDKKKEIWDESILFTRELQLSMFTDEYPKFVIEFIDAVVDLTNLIKETMEICNGALSMEKIRSEDIDVVKRLYEEELEDCISSSSLLIISDSDIEDEMGRILSVHKEKGYGIGYHNPKITKPQMMLHAARVLKHKAKSLGIVPSDEERKLFGGDMEIVLSVRHILNNISLAKKACKTISNLLAVLYLDYAKPEIGNKDLFVQYANGFLPVSDRIKPGSIYRPTKNFNNKRRHEIESAFNKILETMSTEKVS